MSIKNPYSYAFNYIYSLEKYGIRLGLKRIKTLLKYLGNPQDKVNIVHVAGTNGKGSTAALAASILMKAGYKVGLYTSPHLVRFNERIRIDGKEIPDNNIAELVKRIRNGCQNYTFFECITAMAFLYFAEKKVDFAVMEVGLGGRLDATNVGRPLVSIITNIAKDHEAVLGNRIKDIAFEKGGIIKRDGILISAETKPAAVGVLRNACRKKGAVLYRLNKDFFIENTLVPIPKWDAGQSATLKKKGEMGFVFKGRRWFYQDLTLNLLGRHQYLNVACALAALEILEEKGYRISESAVRKGLQGVLWSGRLECISKKPLIILDCAHNPAGAAVLRDALLDFQMNNKNNKTKIILVLGVMADKDIKGILSILLPIADMVILTCPQLERAASVELLYKHVLAYVNMGKVGRYADKVRRIDGVKDACLYAIAEASVNDMICITGSVFTVGEAKKALRPL